jgi:hypothetical protein
MMTALSARSAEIEAQVAAYRAGLRAAGMYADHPVGSVARAWLAARPPTLRSKYLFIERGRRIARQRVDRAVAHVAATAGTRARHAAPAPPHASHAGH